MYYKGANYNEILAKIKESYVPEMLLKSIMASARIIDEAEMKFRLLTVFARHRTVKQ